MRSLLKRAVDGSATSNVLNILAKEPEKFSTEVMPYLHQYCAWKTRHLSSIVLLSSNHT